MTMPDRIWIWFADNGNIRKWQREPFEEGTEFVSTVTPAEVGGLVAEWRKAMEHVTPGPWRVYDGCSWRRIGTAHGKHDDCAVVYPYNASDGHPDLGSSRGNDTQANLAWLARCSPDRIDALLTILEAHASALTAERAAHAETRRERDEARKALEPFAWIGQWLFARDLPDETPVVMVEGAGKPFALTRGMFKAAHTAARRALEAQGGE